MNFAQALMQELLENFDYSCGNCGLIVTGMSPTQYMCSEFVGWKAEGTCPHCEENYASYSFIDRPGKTIISNLHAMLGGEG